MATGERSLFSTALDLQYTEVDLAELRLPNRVFRHRYFDFYIDEHRVESSQKITSALEAKEEKLLLFLCANPNRVCSYRELLKKIWDINSTSAADISLLRPQIAQLRTKLGAGDGEIIETVVKFGYRLVDPDRQPAYEQVELEDSSSKNQVFKHPLFDFNRYSREIIVGEKIERLSPKVAEVLILLMEHPNIAVRHQDFANRLWPGASAIEIREVLKNYTSTIRRQIRRLGINPAEVIFTDLGRGYRLLDRSA